MKNTLKSIFIVMLAPVVLTVAFHSNQIKSAPKRAPAVESKQEVRSIKNAVKGYLLAVNGVKNY